MELGLVKLAAKLFGIESDDLQGAAGTQVMGFWQIIALPCCLFLLYNSQYSKILRVKFIK